MLVTSRDTRALDHPKGWPKKWRGPQCPRARSVRRGRTSRGSSDSRPVGNSLPKAASRTAASFDAKWRSTRYGCCDESAGGKRRTPRSSGVREGSSRHSGGSPKMSTSSAAGREVGRLRQAIRRSRLARPCRGSQQGFLPANKPSGGRLERIAPAAAIHAAAAGKGSPAYPRLPRRPAGPGTGDGRRSIARCTLRDGYELDKR